MAGALVVPYADDMRKELDRVGVAVPLLQELTDVARARSRARRRSREAQRAGVDRGAEPVDKGA